MAIIGWVDISCLLSSPLLPSKILILLAVACLGWIGLLSLAFMIFLGTGISAGWILSGALVLALIVWIIVMSSELRQAIDLRGDFTPEDWMACKPQPAAQSSPGGSDCGGSYGFSTKTRATKRDSPHGRRNMRRPGKPGARRRNQPQHSAIR